MEEPPEKLPESEKDAAVGTVETTGDRSVADAVSAGAAEHEAAPAEATTPLEAAEPTVERPLVDADATAEQPAAPSGPAGADTADAPRLRDVAGTFGGYAKGRLRVVRAFVGRHRVASALLVLLAVAMVASLAVALSQAGALPEVAAVQEDARSRVSAPAYDAGTFGADDILVARDVDVRSRERTSSAIESEGAQFGASGYATADVLVTFSGSSVRAEKATTLGYARVDGSWMGIGDEGEAQVSWEALSGVDQQKVVRNIRTLLARAESSLEAGAQDGSPAGDAQELTLTEIYADAQVEITSESFDAEAQTDTLQIRCTRASSFEAYVCDLTVTFAFQPASGTWTVSDISASPGAKTRTFDPVEGTWEGTFQSQETDGAKCLAAREAGLSVTITGNKTADGVTRLTGTVSGVAHYHDHPGQDSASTEGDARFEDVPFTATLVGGHNDATDSDLAFVATLPEDVGGTVTMTLGFGTADDPGRVVAVVETTYPHTGSFLFFPVEKTITYADTFTLTQR